MPRVKSRSSLLPPQIGGDDSQDGHRGGPHQRTCAETNTGQCQLTDVGRSAARMTNHMNSHGKHVYNDSVKMVVEAWACGK